MSSKPQNKEDFRDEEKICAYIFDTEDPSEIALRIATVCDDADDCGADSREVIKLIRKWQEKYKKIHSDRILVMTHSVAQILMENRATPEDMRLIFEELNRRLVMADTRQHPDWKLDYELR